MKKENEVKKLNLNRQWRPVRAGTYPEGRPPEFILQDVTPSKSHFKNLRNQVSSVVAFNYGQQNRSGWYMDQQGTVTFFGNYVYQGTKNADKSIFERVYGYGTFPKLRSHAYASPMTDDYFVNLSYATFKYDNDLSDPDLPNGMTYIGLDIKEFCQYILGLDDVYAMNNSNAQPDAFLWDDLSLGKNMHYRPAGIYRGNIKIYNPYNFALYGSSDANAWRRQPIIAKFSNNNQRVEKFCLNNLPFHIFGNSYFVIDAQYCALHNDFAGGSRFWLKKSTEDKYARTNYDLGTTFGTVEGLTDWVGISRVPTDIQYPTYNVVGTSTNDNNILLQNDVKIQHVDQTMGFNYKLLRDYYDTSVPIRQVLSYYSTTFNGIEVGLKTDKYNHDTISYNTEYIFKGNRSQAEAFNVQFENNYPYSVDSSCNDNRDILFVNWMPEGRLNMERSDWLLPYDKAPYEIEELNNLPALCETVYDKTAWPYVVKPWVKDNFGNYQTDMEWRGTWNKRFILPQNYLDTLTWHRIVMRERPFWADWNFKDTNIIANIDTDTDLNHVKLNRTMTIDTSVSNTARKGVSINVPAGIMFYPTCVYPPLSLAHQELHDPEVAPIALPIPDMEAYQNLSEIRTFKIDEVEFNTAIIPINDGYIDKDGRTHGDVIYIRASSNHFELYRLTENTQLAKETFATTKRTYWGKPTGTWSGERLYGWTWGEVKQLFRHFYPLACENPNIVGNDKRMIHNNHFNRLYWDEQYVAVSDLFLQQVDNIFWISKQNVAAPIYFSRQRPDVLYVRDRFYVVIGDRVIGVSPRRKNANVSSDEPVRANDSSYMLDDNHEVALRLPINILDPNIFRFDVIGQGRNATPDDNFRSWLGNYRTYGYNNFDAVSGESDEYNSTKYIEKGGRGAYYLRTHLEPADDRMMTRSTETLEWQDPERYILSSGGGYLSDPLT